MENSSILELPVNWSKVSFVCLQCQHPDYLHCQNDSLKECLKCWMKDTLTGCHKTKEQVRSMYQ